MRGVSNMADTIKDTLNRLVGGLTVNEQSLTVDEALAEIKRIVSEARPAGHSEALDEYHNNLMKVIGDG